MRTRTLALLISLAITATALVLSCGSTQVVETKKPGGSGTEVIGVLVDTTGARLNLAKVTLYAAVPADSILDTNNFLKITYTTGGSYKFDSVHAGSYQIRTSYNSGALVGSTNTFVYSDTSIALDLGTDTLRAPGSIHGCATLLYASAQGIQVYVPGTSFSAWTDANGCYTMTGVAPGTYTISYAFVGYTRVDVAGINVYSGQTSDIPLVDMMIDPTAPVPVPQGLMASFDTAAGLVFLVWDGVQVSDLSAYQVWLDSSDIPGHLVEVGSPTNAPIYLDSIHRLLTGKSRDTIRYQVTAIDNDNHQSGYSAPVSVIIVRDSMIKTAFSLSPLPDTIRVGDTLHLAMRFTNPTRTNTSLTWWKQQGTDWISLRQNAPNSSSGWDTLQYVPADSGIVTLNFQAIDDAGYSWSTTKSLGVRVSAYTPNTWETLAPMKKARRYLGTTVLNDTIYAIGGVFDYIPPDGSTAQQIPEDTVEVFDPKTGVWSVKPSMVMERSGFGLAALNGKLYAMGGHTKVVRGTRTSIVVTDSIEVWDPASGRWALAGVMPAPRYNFSLVAWNDRLYAAGGVEGTMEDIFTSDIDMFNPATGTWTTIGHLNTPRYYHTATCMDGKLYIFGGIDSNGNALSSGEVVDLSTGIATQLPPMAGSRANLGAAAVQNAILIMGGSIDYTSNWSLNPAIETYDPTRSQWSSAARLPMQPPVQCFGTVSYRGSVYVIGGTAQQAAIGYMGQSSTVYKYNP